MTIEYGLAWWIASWERLDADPLDAPRAVRRRKPHPYAAGAATRVAATEHPDGAGPGLQPDEEALA